MEELNLKLTIDEINTVLESLGDQPYVKVYQLVSKIQKQSQEQLRASEKPVGLVQSEGNR